MIFAFSSEDAWELFEPFRRIQSLISEEEVMTIRAENGEVDLTLFSSTFSISYRTEHVEIEREGEITIPYDKFFRFLESTKKESSSYRFISSDEILKVKFGIGSFSLRSHYCPNQETSIYEDEFSKNTDQFHISVQKLSDAAESVVSCFDSEQHDIFHYGSMHLRTYNGTCHLELGNDSCTALYDLNLNLDQKNRPLSLETFPFVKIIDRIFGDDENAKWTLDYDNMSVYLEKDDLKFRTRLFRSPHSTLSSEFTDEFHIHRTQRFEESQYIVSTYDLENALDVCCLSQERSYPKCSLKFLAIDEIDHSLLLNTYPQLEGRNVEGILRLDTSSSSYEVPIPVASDFQKSEVEVSPLILYRLTEAVEGGAVKIRIVDGPKRIIVCEDVEGGLIFSTHTSEFEDDRRSLL